MRLICCSWFRVCVSQILDLFTAPKCSREVKVYLPPPAVGWVDGKQRHLVDSSWTYGYVSQNCFLSYSQLSYEYLSEGLDLKKTAVIDLKLFIVQQSIQSSVYVTASWGLIVSSEVVETLIPFVRQWWNQCTNTKLWQSNYSIYLLL